MLFLDCLAWIKRTRNILCGPFSACPLSCAHQGKGTCPQGLWNFCRCQRGSSQKHCQTTQWCVLSKYLEMGTNVSLKQLKSQKLVRRKYRSLSKMLAKVLVLTTEEANARKLTARTPSDHSWDTRSNWPYSWPMVTDLGFKTVIWTLFSSINPLMGKKINNQSFI